MKSSIALRIAVLPLLLAGCAVAPSAPSVMSLPGSGKTFDQFRADDADCRQYARYQTGGSGANDAAVRSAAVGTVIGAVAGAAIGGHDGAGVGAGTGLLMGSMVGAGESQNSNYGNQRSYDIAYVQCMYAKGHKVPVSGTFGQNQAPAPASGYYPPPPGNASPPPR